MKARLALAGMKPGEYHVIWYGMQTGEATGPQPVSVAAGGALETSTPAIVHDMAA